MITHRKRGRPRKLNSQQARDVAKWLAAGATYESIVVTLESKYGLRVSKSTINYFNRTGEAK